MGTHPIFESDFDCLTGMNRVLLSVGRRGFGLSTKREMNMAGHSKLKANVGAPNRSVSDYRVAVVLARLAAAYWMYWVWHHHEHHTQHPLGNTINRSLAQDHLLKLYFTNEELGLPKDMTIGSKANVSPDTKMPEKTDPMTYWLTVMELGMGAASEMFNSIIFAISGDESFAPVVSHKIVVLGASEQTAAADEDAEEDEDED